MLKLFNKIEVIYIIVEIIIVSIYIANIISINNSLIPKLPNR